MAAPEVAAPPVTSAPSSDINMRVPSKYFVDKSEPPKDFAAPPLEWLYESWTVAYSTLPMWRSAQNVRITYRPAAAAADIDDLVEYEKKGSLKNVGGIDKPDAVVPGAYNWRGKGWLKWVTSHWEVVGWGERPRPDGAGVDKWAVTWFAPTLFSKEGLDIYSAAKEGLSKETYEDIMAGLKALDAPKLVTLVEKDMREVQINLPWKEKK